MKNYTNILDLFQAPDIGVKELYGNNGNIYITKGNENPAILFGGTWELNTSHMFMGWKIYERLSGDVVNGN